MFGKLEAIKRQTAHQMVVCGVLRIDEGDGLPVELMKFGFDDEAGDGAGGGNGVADEDSTADRESGSD